MSPEEIAVQFYSAFKRLDAEAMGKLYSDSVQFSDPVFPSLRGKDARRMWKMLCKRAPTLRVEFQVLKSTANSATVYWDAYYPFSKTGRMVHNKVTATLEISEGKIVRHTDRFNFWRWSRHALGLPGVLFGWTPLIQSKVQAQAKQGLETFQG